MTGCHNKNSYKFIKKGQKMKDTFFNLSEEKKQSILNAIREEFLQKPFNKARIANIIQKANIPRGSFYQYFENLEEAYFLILEKYIVDSHELFASLLKKNNYDHEKALQQFGCEISEEIFNPENYNLYKYKYLYWTEHLEREYTKYKTKEMTKSLKSTREEKIMFIKAIVHDLVRRAFSENWDKDTFIEKYDIQCSWIFGGIKNGRTI